MAAENVKIYPDKDSLIKTAADQIIALAKRIIDTRGRFSIALAGGSTPKPLYERLAELEYAQQLNWRNVHLFFGDERAVPSDHPDSNYAMVADALLRHIQIPDVNVHRINTEQTPERAAAHYAHELRTFFMHTPAAIDLVLLGLGDDAHTASLFPGTPPTYETQMWVTAHYVHKHDGYRITMTPALINQARNVAFLVSGDDKATALKNVLEGEYNPSKYPAQIIKPTDGYLVWWVDQAAAQALSK
jgi:6-phosphogluconolactonase